MSETKDEFDAQAYRLLPCFDDCRMRSDFEFHVDICAHYYRPAVAAALREAGKQIADLRASWITLNEAYQLATIANANLEAERDQLKAQLAEVERRGMAAAQRNPAMEEKP